MSATFGNNFKVTIFGQSHSEAIGVVIDGLPAGIKIDFDKIDFELKRRQGGDKFSTPRKEADTPKIISGYFDDKTAGSPLCAIFENSNTRSKDYSELKVKMRPSHADYPAYIKHKGNNDYRGGGNFSGRLTLPLTFAGAVAKQLLEEKGVYIGSHIKKINKVEDISFDKVNIDKDKLISLKEEVFPLLDKSKLTEMEDVILKAKNDHDSVGGIIECAVLGFPAGIGSPFFDSIESRLSHLLFSVPAVKGVQFGEGFGFADLLGSEAKDEYYYDEDGNVKTYDNHNGGVLGGISNGQPILFSAVIKPTASISKLQRTIDVEKKENTKLEVVGRHDPVIVKRAIPVIEAVSAICLYDFLLSEQVVL
ncbi:chorismate synthase [Anaerofustis stercorihominis]|uniref:chorismate synthase n=1 Tax=Anaerofustis stercorihominis TaxID=214853 RepID=UPI00214CADC6|nr:chorismate synthase [Anaerofustis stercorihominis]MCR2032738.1 chorismate synthase [Anaerofustis stercorihominis]